MHSDMMSECCYAHGSLRSSPIQCPTYTFYENFSVWLFVLSLKERRWWIGKTSLQTSSFLSVCTCTVYIAPCIPYTDYCQGAKLAVAHTMYMYIAIGALKFTCATYSALSGAISGDLPLEG